MNHFLRQKKEHHSLTSVKIENFDFFYCNEEMASALYEEIFVQKIYEFKTNKKRPVIIDAGSNIGLATLFFKSQYPDAKIICFEPDPNAFNILKTNVTANKLKNVILVNAALSNKRGFVPFYGQMHERQADSRGNSIIKLWGHQQNSSIEVLVKATLLSQFVTEEIDFLKMDIECAEHEVLQELGIKLHLVKEIMVEVHEMQYSPFNNQLLKICSILENAGFYVTKQKVDNIDFLPTQIQAWINRVDPIFSIVKGTRDPHLFGTEG